MTHPPTGPSNPTPPPGPGLTPVQRIDIYLQQNTGRPLTPRQRRRVNHKARRKVV